MKRHAAAAALSATLLAGCATWADMDSGLSALQGTNLSTAVSVLGYPTSENRVGGMRQVIWSSSNSGVLYLPQTSTTTGNVYGTGGYANYSATTSYMAPMAYNHSCTIILRVSDQDVIQGHQYQGNMGGCEPYIRALNQAVKQHRIGGARSPQAALPPEDGKTAMKEQAATYLGCVATAAHNGKPKNRAAAVDAQNAAIDSCEPELKKYRAAAFRNAQIEFSDDPIAAADAAELELRRQGRTIAGM